MMRRRELLSMLATVPLLGQEQLPERTFSTTVSEVVAPVTVLTKSGSYANGLEQRDFRLYDNDKLQDIRLDVTYNPISMVVAIQRNARVESLLPNIKKIGNMLESMVIGEYGEAALLAFDSRLRWLTDFTNDGAEFSEALETLRPGSRSSRMIDAVFEAIRKLRSRPRDYRRVLVLISETRDGGSEGRTRDALIEAEFNNIIVYTININRAITTLTQSAPAPRPNPQPAAARPIAGALGPETPQTSLQLSGGYSLSFVPIIKEIFTQAKSLIVPNPAEVFTQYTGGREYSFVSLSSLEQALSDLGEELHSQYIISYQPNNMEEGGYHEIRVEVRGPSLEVRTRPGYWAAAKYDETDETGDSASTPD